MQVWDVCEELQTFIQDSKEFLWSEVRGVLKWLSCGTRVPDLFSSTVLRIIFRFLQIWFNCPKQRLKSLQNLDFP